MGTEKRKILGILAIGALLLALAACGGPAPREGEGAPAPAESGAPEAARKAMLSPSDEGAKPWLELARSDPARALRLAREFLAGSGGDAFRWESAAPLLKRLVGLGTPEALSLVLESMEKPEREFEAGGERGEAFFQALRGAPRAFARRVEEAAVRKIRGNVLEETASWDTLEGYFKLAGSFGGGEAEGLLRELYALRQESLNLPLCALRGLCMTGKTELIGFFLDAAPSLDFLLLREAGDMAELGRREFLAALEERVADVPYKDRSFAARRAFAEMLGRHGGREALPFFEALFSRPDGVGRRLALRGLGRVSDLAGPAELARARAMVLRGLEDEDPVLRILACHAVADRGFLPPEEGLAALRAREAAERDEEALEALRVGIADLQEAIREEKRGGK